MVSTYLVVGEKLQIPLVDFLGKWNGFGFLWILVFLVWERGHSTVNSPCFLTMRPKNFLEFDFNLFYQTISFIWKSKGYKFECEIERIQNFKYEFIKTLTPCYCAVCKHKSMILGTFLFFRYIHKVPGMYIVYTCVNHLLNYLSFWGTFLNLLFKAVHWG